MNGAIIDGRFTNVFWIRNGNAVEPDGAALQALAKGILDQYAASFLPHLASNVTAEGCQLLYYKGGQEAVGSEWIENHVGTRAGAPLPAQVSCGITWGIQQRYRGGHPRTYLPPTTQDATTSGNKFATTYCDEIKLAANQFHAAVNAFSNGALAQLHLGTVSFVLTPPGATEPAWRTPPVFRDYTPAAASVDRRIDTQRRRLGRDL